MKSNAKVFLTSDTHFFHAKIVELARRPANFQELIIKNWKRLVRPQDIVLHLGDVIFAGSKELVKMNNELPGIKILVLGNHDHKSPLWYMQKGFSFACYEFQWEKYIFTHKPIEKVPEGKINVHGHFHNSQSHHVIEKEFPFYKHNKHRYRLVSIEENNYKPIILDNNLKLC